MKEEKRRKKERRRKIDKMIIREDNYKMLIRRR